MEQFGFLQKHLRYLLRETAKEIAEGKEIHPSKFGKKKAVYFVPIKQFVNLTFLLKKTHFVICRICRMKISGNCCKRGYFDEKSSDVQFYGENGPLNRKRPSFQGKDTFW